MRRVARPTLLGLLLAASGIADAAEVRLEVREKGTRALVADVRIAADDVAGRTDSHGIVVLELPAGEVALRLLDTRYWMAPVTLEITGESVSHTVWLTLRPEAAEVVGIYGGPSSEGPARVVLAEEIRALPGTMNDPIRAIQSLPGTTRTPFDAGWLIVRGGGYDDTGLFLDGIRVPQLFHLGGAVSILHPELLESVRLSPNDSPARLGRSLTGAVDLIPRRLDDLEHVRLSGGANLIFAEAYAEAPVGSGGAAVGVRRSYLDGVLTLAVGRERAQIAPRFWDAQARYDTAHTGWTVVAASDQLTAPSSDPTQGNLVARQRSAQLQGRITPGATPLEFRTWVGTSERAIKVQPDQQRVAEINLGLRAEAKARWGAWRARGGLELQHTRYLLDQGFTQLVLKSDAVDLDDTEEQTSKEARQGTASFADPYLDLATQGHGRLHLGVRADTLLVPSQLPRAGLSPRWGASWPLTDGLDVQLEASRSHQAPPTFLLLGFPEGTYLPLEQSDQVSGGPRWELGPVRTEIDAYLRRSRSLAEFEADGTIGQLDGKAWGLETWTRAQLGQHEIRVVYQYTRAMVREEITHAQGPTRYDQPHRVELVTISRLPRHLIFSARLRAHSGFPAAEDERSAFDILQQRDVFTPVHNDRLAAFYAIDLKLMRRFSYRAWRLDASLDLQNITNRRVPEPVINGIDESRASMGFGLPFLPVFGLEAAGWPRK